MKRIAYNIAIQGWPSHHTSPEEPSLPRSPVCQESRWNARGSKHSHRKSRHAVHASILLRSYHGSGGKRRLARQLDPLATTLHYNRWMVAPEIPGRGEESLWKMERVGESQTRWDAAHRTIDVVILAVGAVDKKLEFRALIRFENPIGCFRDPSSEIALYHDENSSPLTMNLPSQPDHSHQGWQNQGSQGRRHEHVQAADGRFRRIYHSDQRQA